MKRFSSVRVLFVTLLLFTIFGMVGGHAIAQDTSNGRSGWGVAAVTPPPVIVGPPPLSIRPIQGPEDIPLVRAQIEGYVQSIRAYLQTLFGQLFPIETNN